MELEVGETFGISTSVDEDDTWSKLGHVFIEEYDLYETLIGTSCEYVLVVGSANPDFVDNISPNPLDTFHASSSCSPPSPSPECCDMLLIDSHAILEGNEIDCSESPGTLRGYDPSIDLYRLYLEDMLGKIILTSAFDYFSDFSNTFDMFRRALVVMHAFIFVCSHLYSSELHGQVFDKFMRALTASDLVARVLR